MSILFYIFTYILFFVILLSLLTWTLSFQLLVKKLKRYYPEQWENMGCPVYLPEADFFDLFRLSTSRVLGYWIFSKPEFIETVEGAKSIYFIFRISNISLLVCFLLLAFDRFFLR